MTTLVRHDDSAVAAALLARAAESLRDSPHCLVVGMYDGFP
jgi:hypothetical protein